LQSNRRSAKKESNYHSSEKKTSAVFLNRTKARQKKKNPLTLYLAMLRIHYNSSFRKHQQVNAWGVAPLTVLSTPTKNSTASMESPFASSTPRCCSPSWPSYDATPALFPNESFTSVGHDSMFNSGCDCYDGAMGFGTPRNCRPLIAFLPNEPTTPQTIARRSSVCNSDPPTPSRYTQPLIGIFSSEPSTPQRQGSELAFGDSLSSQPQSQPTFYTILRDEKIGKGNHGVVFKAWDNVNGGFVAVKEIPLKRERNSSFTLREEYNTMAQLDHPNILKVRGYEMDRQLARVYMEWMPSGSIQHVMQKTGHRILENVVRTYMRQTLQGLAYLHRKNIVHRDIKPANLLLGNDGQIKLADFGTALSCDVLTGSDDDDQVGSPVVGTPLYMSPEGVRGQVCAANDIFAFGCSFVELLSGMTPWFHLHIQDRSALILKIGRLSNGDDHPLIPEHIGAGCRALLKRCFAVNPQDRASAVELLADPYFRCDVYASRGMETVHEFQCSLTSDTLSRSFSTDSDRAISRGVTASLNEHLLLNSGGCGCDGGDDNDTIMTDVMTDIIQPLIGSQPPQ